MKKHFGTFICLYFVLAVLLAPRAFAAEIIDSGYCGGEGDGTNLTWTLDSEGTLTISGEGAMADWDFKQAVPWYIYPSPVKKVVVSNMVTNIGRAAFSGCDALTQINIPDGVTSIGLCAFSNCDSLTQITLPDCVASIGEAAFEGCASLTQINIPDNVTTIGESAFRGCASLAQINIPNSVTSIGEAAFSSCSSLAEVTVDDYNAFYEDVFGVLYNKEHSTLYCYPAGNQSDTFIIPDSVSTIGAGAFSGCSFLTQITIPNSVTAIGSSAFSDCDSLTQITIPNSVTSISSSAFFDCDSLSQITIPDSVTSIAYHAFSGCSALAQIAIPDSVTFIGNGAFSWCTSLVQISIPDGVASIADNTFQDCALLTQITLPDSITSIGNASFYGCTSLPRIIIPKGVTYIDAGAFAYCSSLKQVVFNGDAPRDCEMAFSNVAATVYYPADNPTWTEDKLQDYDGDLTWVPYTEDMIYHTRFSMDTIPQDEFDLEITVARLGDSANDVAMISLYSPEGKCLETVLWQLTDDAGQTYTLSRDNTDGKIGQIKVFVLDSLSNPIPLAEAAEITSGT